MNKFLSVATFILISSFAQDAVAQAKLPKWVTSEPQSTTSIKRVVTQGSTPEEAHHNAVNRLVSIVFQNQYEEGSYQDNRLSKGLAPIEQHRSIVEKAEQSLAFKTTKAHEADGVYYEQCEVVMKDYQSFRDSLYQDIINTSANALLEARRYKKEGDLYSAASESVEGLKNLLPMIHRPLTFAGEDLVTELHESYLHSLDSIEWRFDLDDCPIVKGEEVPIYLHAMANYRGVPVPGLPVSVALTDNGKITWDDITDTNGRSKIHITQAPATPISQLLVKLDAAKAKEQLPSHPFSTELPLGLSQDMQASMRLTAFDPVPHYYLDMDSLDRVSIGDSIKAIFDRKNYIEVNDRSLAELEVKTVSSVEQASAPTTGKYRMVNYNATLSFEITELKGNNSLLSLTAPSVRLFVPAVTNDEELHQHAVAQLLYRMRSNLMEKTAGFNYDKRKVVWEATQAKQK